jgi:hypothetical protein
MPGQIAEHTRARHTNPKDAEAREQGALGKTRNKDLFLETHP